MRIALFLIGLLALSAPIAGHADDDDLTRITQFLVGYTGDTSPEFSSRIERSLGNGNQTLENLVSILLLYEKVSGDDGNVVIPRRLLSNLSHFSNILYPSQVARLAILDYVLGTAETTQAVRKLSETLRSNTRLSRALTGARRSLALQRMLKRVSDAATSASDLEVEPTFSRLLTELGLGLPVSDPPLIRRSRLVTVSQAEVRDRIATVAAGALRPSNSPFSKLPETDLRRLLIDESMAVRHSALEALCETTIQEVDSIASLMAVRGAEWVESSERERIDRALERSLPLAVRSRLAEPNSVEFARCLLELLLSR